MGLAWEGMGPILERGVPDGSSSEEIAGRVFNTRKSFVRKSTLSANACCITEAPRIWGETGKGSSVHEGLWTS